MASTPFSAADCALLATPLEIRRHIYGFCIPQHLTFDCTGDMYYQNRPAGWIEPPWHSNESCGRYSVDGEGNINEFDYLTREWRLEDKLTPLEEVGSVCAEDSSAEGDGEGYRMKEDFIDLEPGSPYYPTASSNKSALPALLVLCRQINDEAETMLYQGNTFTVDIHYQGQYHVDRQFTKRNRERMRNLILVLRPIGAPFQPNALMDPAVWDAVLGNLTTLGVVVEQPEPPLLEWLEDSEKEAPGNFLDFLADRKRRAVGEWMTWLLPIFEYLVRAVPAQTEILVDVTEEEDTVQALEFFRDGPFRFQKLPTADAVSNRVEFAWESGSRASWYPDQDDSPTSCRDIIQDSDYEYYYSD
ncbi:hypothetical protein F4802DRAFT_305597 [Xylaria palmicola]|nr:hypothetical protein F4802DRAFT_305597 [Xylaria palmicola]